MDENESKLLNLMKLAMEIPEEKKDEIIKQVVDYLDELKRSREDR